MSLGMVLAIGLSWCLAGSSASAAPLGTLTATYQATPPPSAGAGTTVQIPVTVTNTSTAGEIWNATGAAPVNLSYHWYDGAGNVVAWDGARTGLGADVAPGASKTVTASVTHPLPPRTTP